MKTLITGVPGAGKTLYCVDKLLRALVGATVKHEREDGVIVDVPRVIYTNVNGLLLEHEKIGPGAPWTYDSKTDSWSQPADGDKFGLNNWHEWAKPGAVICYDEIQKPWPLAPAGSKVPPCITALETHRHMGVDFIELTQHPMLIHANVVRLVGRHLHVRRMGNMGLAIVYEWDSCSRTLLYKNALAKAPYRYSKKVFELYKSAELHTKQPRRIPSLVWGVLFGLCALAWFAPVSYSRISQRINPTPVVVKPAAPAPVVTTFVGKDADTAAHIAAIAAQAAPVSPEEVVAGCVRSGPLCRCYSATARLIEKALSYCQAETTTPAIAAPPRQFSHVSDVVSAPAPPDLDMVEWVRKQRRPL
jgi:zona occludens toxin